MTPTLAQQVEQVLKEHLGVQGYPGHPITVSEPNTVIVGPAVYRELVSDLVALLSPTAPMSREELRNLFGCHFQGQEKAHPEPCEELLEVLMAWAAPYPLRKEELDALWEHHDHKYGSADEWRQAMKDAIWRWATGQREAKTWCEHILWSAVGWIEQHHWYYHDVESLEILVTGWKSCPLCGRPRPA